MKRIIAFALALAGVLTACGSDEKPNTNTNTNTFDYKTGLATYTHTNNTYSTTRDKDGQSAVSTTIVAAVFDNNGKIIDINIDEVESKTRFDSTGRLIDYTGGEVVSKRELGDDYNMKAASGIGKEWYEQIDTLEKWLVGRDVNTVISSAKGRVSGLMDWAGADRATWGAEGRTAANSRTMNSNSDGNSVTGNSNSNSMTGGMGNDVTGGTAGGDIMDGVNSAIDDITGYNTDAPVRDDSWMDADLKAGVTIDTTYIQRAIEKAYRNAK